MKKTIMILLTAVLASQMAFADGWLKDFNYTLRVGGNIGGTAPIGLPATIRGLNSMKIRPNLSLGVDAIKPLNNHWKLMVGLRAENKDMNMDARVKSYQMAMEQGAESVEGYYTGNVQTVVRQKMITLPVRMAINVNPDLSLQFGPYMSVLIEKEFSGCAHGGYLRVDNPTGARMDIGEDDATKGTYDFSKDMRYSQFGLMAGADWYFNKHWGVYGDLCWGLTGIHKSGFKTIDQTLYPIYATIGFIYRFHRR